MPILQTIRKTVAFTGLDGAFQAIYGGQFDTKKAEESKSDGEPEELEAVAPTSAARGPVWRTIISGGLSQQQLLDEIKAKSSVVVHKWANEVIGKIGYSSEHREIPIVRVSVREWFTIPPTDPEMLREARRHKLDLLPADAALYLRLQYEDQPKDEWLTAAHEPVRLDDGFRVIFRLGRDHTQFTEIDTYEADDKQKAELYHIFLFAAQS